VAESSGSGTSLTGANELPSEADVDWSLNCDIIVIDWLQDASRTNSRDAFDKFVQSATESARHCTLRGQLEFVMDSTQSVALDEVESAASIVKRFCTGLFIHCYC